MTEPADAGKKKSGGRRYRPAGTRKAGRRERGSGSYETLPSGRTRWRVKVSGKWYSGTTDTLSEAKDAVGKVQNARSENMLAKPSTMTVAQYATKWLEYKAAEGRSPATLDSYERQLRNNILPHIGDVKLQKLSGSHLQDLYKAWYQQPVHKTPRKADGKGHERVERSLLVAQGKGTLVEKEVKTSRGNGTRKIQVFQRTEPAASPAPKLLANASLKTAHAVLNGLLAHAVTADILKVNPAASVRPSSRPDGRAKAKTSYSVKELMTILPVLRSTPRYLIFEMILGLGTRRGEACGLEWQHVDWNAGTVHLVRGVKVVKGKPVMGPLKTDGSERLVKIPPRLLERLREWQALQAAEREATLASGGVWADHGLVFSTHAGGRKGAQAGGPIDPNSLKSTFGSICARAGVQTLSIQALRRTFTTLRRKRGVALEVVAADLGHTDTRTLLAFYRAVDDEERLNAAEDLDDTLQALRQ